MRQALALVILAALITASAIPARAGKYPQPSIYPIAWQLGFKHGTPKRIVVGADAYWYLTYTVTNKTGEEQLWAPTFDMVANDGKIVKSGHNVSPNAFVKIRAVERNRFLEPSYLVVGTLHQGDDQAKDSVAIWKEPNPRMGTFKIYVTGLSGEVVTAKEDDGKDVKSEDGTPVFLRKTLELTYAVYGDEFYPQRHEIHDLGETWVMR
ncbi:MAG TPA: hypothetical protein VIM11_23820 [Tepidisphaeraceae bacterium]|jgi:hypothetical protein